MSTKFTQPITIDAPGGDIVFDGVDFVDNGIVNIVTANSVTFRNCRFYNIALDAMNKVSLISDGSKSNTAGYKLVIENCYFGKSGAYNMINLYQPLHDGSSFSHNYCKTNCANDDRFSCYTAVKDAEYKFNGNEFEHYTHNGFQFSFRDDADVVVNINDNMIGFPDPMLNYEDRGIARFRPFPNATTSFEHVVVNASGNKFAGEVDRIVWAQRKSEKDIVLTEENVPTYYLNGIATPMEIVDLTIPPMEFDDTDSE